MFTAMILICASGIKDVDTCYVNVHDSIFETRSECKLVIAESIRDYPDLFEWYDDSIDETWKITDVECVNWKSMKA